MSSFFNLADNTLQTLQLDFQTSQTLTLAISDVVGSITAWNQNCGGHTVQIESAIRTIDSSTALSSDGKITVNADDSITFNFDNYAHAGVWEVWVKVVSSGFESAVGYTLHLPTLKFKVIVRNKPCEVAT
jgi:hypothetical protein